VKRVGDCTADPPKDGSARVFKAEARRTRRKKFSMKKLSDLRAPAVNILHRKPGITEIERD
jgi:hypothetical protein